MDDGMLTPIEQRFAGVTLAYLERCTSVGSAFFAEILTRPRAGSVADLALHDKDFMEPIYLAGMYLHVALDHYLTVRSTFIPAEVPPGAPLPTVRNYSPYTVVRGALEADAWACWLLDPDRTPTQRLARAMTVRALNLREVRRLGLPSESGVRIDYDERIARVSAVATRHHLKEKRNGDQELVWVGEARPNMTDLLNELLPDTSAETNGEPLGWHIYSLLSARAHGNPWAVLHNMTSRGRVGSHAAIAEVVIDVVELMRLLSIALRLHSEAVSRLGRLDGREPGEWEALRGPSAESRLAVHAEAP
jgi:hypothetical protein